MNTKKTAALGKRIDETKKKIAALREQNAAAPKTLGVAFLIETELEKASLIMGAKNISSDLQSQAEKLAKVEADQVMPIIDQLKTTFGNEAAEAFYRSVTAAIRELVDQIQKTKDVINDNIMRLENGAAGMPMNDISMDAGADGVEPAPEMGDDLDMGGDVAPEMDAPDGGDAPVDPAAAGLDGADDLEDDDFSQEMSSAAGRARKESAEKFDRAILEYFKKAVQLGNRPTAAATMVAEGFKVDVADVKELVREAAAKKSK